MLVLASASPRRQELLRNAGIAFVARPTDIPETPNKDEAPRAFAERMAREKALAAFDTQPEDFVLGADTIVVVDAEILGKPRNSADAARMLRLLSGRTHEVITGVCLLGRRIRRCAIGNHNRNYEHSQRGRHPILYLKRRTHGQSRSLRYSRQSFALDFAHRGRLFQRGGITGFAGISNDAGARSAVKQQKATPFSQALFRPCLYL